jgi:DNA-binding transcriptional LysR family regulator
MDQLERIRIFVAVAAAKSFTAGARRRGVSIRQTSAAVHELEKHLGVRLFNRTTRSVVLTDIGSTYLQRCCKLLEDFDDLESSVQEQQQQLTGHLRISAPTAYGSLIVAPLLHEFLTRHDRISLDLELTDRRISLIEEGFDLAIRLGALEDSTLICRRLAAMRTVVCAAPSYLKVQPTPRTPHELKDHECLINSYTDEPRRWRFQKKGKPLDVRVRGRLQSSAPLAIAQFAVKGLGIAQCPHYVVQTALREGHLSSLLEDWERDDSGVFVLYPPTRYLSGRLRALIDYLASSLSGGTPGR